MSRLTKEREAEIRQCLKYRQEDYGEDYALKDILMELDTVRAERDELEKEVQEQARLNGMDSEREAVLQAKLAEKERKCERLSAMQERLRMAEELLEECRIAIFCALETECGCESGNEYEPEFICGYHNLDIKIEELLAKSEPIDPPNDTGDKK